MESKTDKVLHNIAQVIGFTFGVFLRFALISFNVYAAIYFLNYFGFLGFLKG